MAFAKFMRPLTLCTSSFLVFYYLPNFEMHATMCDKLLTALTASKSMTRLLSDIDDWLMLLESHVHHLSEDIV